MSQIKEKLQELEVVLCTLDGVNGDLEQEALNRASEIDTLSVKIQERNQLVEHLLRQKDLFITQLAHDLRTPLTPVVAMLPLLIEGIHDPDSQELLNIFYSSIEHLQKMVDEIIHYATLNQMTAIDDYQVFDLYELITDTLAMDSYFLEQKEVSVQNSIPEGVRLSLSKSLAPVIFRNLIANAVQFNAFRGSITIQSVVQKGWITISITDTGVGMSEDVLSSIWDEFSTGDKSRRDPSSKGLGLPIVKRIVTMHGGSIIAMSNGIGTGATFTLTLPQSQDLIQATHDIPFELI